MHKPALKAGAFFAGLAVIFGAFGAHALKAKLAPDQLAIFQTGVQYQFYHSFALLLTGVIFSAFPVKQIKLAGTFFIIGILLFSGSLYAMSLLSITGVGLGPIGIVKPIGGLMFILGWAFLFLGIAKNK